jgi:hypothetical protein
MIRVFQMRVDVNRYQFFLTDPPEDFARLHMDCAPLGDTWVPPPVFVLYPKYLQGDFFSADYSVLIASSRATEALHQQFTWAGEVLPLPYTGETFGVVNVLKCIDALDQEKTVFRVSTRPTAYREIQRYAFRPERLVETSLFKIPETNQIFVLEGTNEFELEFREAVTHAGLQGLLFREIWNEEDGPVGDDPNRTF